MPKDTHKPRVSERHETHPYYGFQRHSTGTNNNTEAVILDVIRSAHLDMHVTAVSGKECDLFGWVEAGHAALNMNRQDNHFISHRLYHARVKYVRHSVDRLGEHITFAELDLEFNSTTFHLYTAEWAYSLFRHKTRMFYLLSPISGLDENGHSPAVDNLLLTVGKWTSEPHDEVWVFDSGDWDKDANLWNAIKSSRWADILLDPATKTSLTDDVLGFFNSKAIYREHMAPWKRGLIFHGPPGNGKTITIKALGNSVGQCKENVTILIVKSFEDCRGPQEGVRSIFSHARAFAPCVLVFEDLDSLLVDTVRSYFLNEVDGLEDNDGILIIASTNHLERLDPAITKRPSRFDRKYYFKPPGESDRILYLEQWRERLAGNKKIDFDSKACKAVAKTTEGFSFAYLKELIIQALLATTGANIAEDIKSENGDAASSAAEGSDRVNRELDTNSRILDMPTALNCAADGTPESLVPESLEANEFVRTLYTAVASLRRDIEGKDEREDSKQ